MVALPSPQTTLIILLGASEWPYAHLRKSQAFANSAIALEKYFREQYELPEENLLNLFDCESSADDIDLEINKFLDRRITETSGSSNTIRDVVVYFIGHGIIKFMENTSRFFLAIRRSRTENPRTSSLEVQSLAGTLKEKARNLRRIVILDCCFAGSAASLVQAGGVEDVVRKGTVDYFLEKGVSAGIPLRGTSILCSSSRDDFSYLMSDESQTKFTHALLHVLSEGASYLPDIITLQDLKKLTEDYLLNTYREEVSRPEVHSPDQREGKVEEVPFFPNIKKQKKVVQNKKFKQLKDTIQCYIVLSEVGSKRKTGKSLNSIVAKALIDIQSKIEQIINGNQSLNTTPYYINVVDILSDPEMYENAIFGLCCAHIAIFDVTNYEPGVMLLLGIRSVVRRGITILTSYNVEQHFEAPFNIKETKIISHSEENNHPISLLGNRILEGFDQHLRIPYYLDLPVFDAVRLSSPDITSRPPKDYHKQILVLCPFEPEYTKNNWKRYLEENLRIYIKQRERFKDIIKLTMRRNENKDFISLGPSIVRTLDIPSPRLVSQNLYEEIRLSSMCIVDWTGWRPNVFFELGVRLAVSSIGPVCIIENKYNNLLRILQEKLEDDEIFHGLAGITQADYPRLKSSINQCHQLCTLFRPIEYKAPSENEGDDEDDKAYNKFFAYYESLATGEWKTQQESRTALAPDFTYNAIIKYLDTEYGFALNSVSRELIDSADLLSTSDSDSVGKLSILYSENSQISKKASEGAFERRFAAWYYLHNRYTHEEIANDTSLTEQYEDIAAILIDILGKSPLEDERRRAITISKEVTDFKYLMRLKKGKRDVAE